MLKKVAFLILTVISVISCEPKKVKSITPTQLQDMVNNNVQFHLIDLRNKKSFNKDHLKGAENIVFNDDFQINMQKFDKGETIVLYAENENKCIKAAQVLFDEDYKLVYYFLKPYSSWQNEINKI